MILYLLMKGLNLRFNVIDVDNFVEAEKVKKIIILTLLFLSFAASGYRKPDVYVIDASKNAFLHNNMGLRYMNEHCYYAAIQEFKIAISLSTNTQATAVYYNNIGNAYMEIGYPDMARQPFEDAIKQFSLNFKYYQDLVKCYIALGLVNEKIREYSGSSNVLNKVMLGLLYIENGDSKRGIIILDEFVMTEPDLLITPAVKQYIKETVNKMNSL